MTALGDPIEERLAAAIGIAARSVGAPENFEAELARPRDADHGDWASNAALVLASSLGKPPREIAEAIAGALDRASAGVSEVSVAGPGFINFRLSDQELWPGVASVIAADVRWGRADSGAGRRVNVEFVSTNPTGPLHVAHGRGAAIGDAVAALLEWTGNDVTREFYINDSGRQIKLLAESVEARYQESRGRDVAVPEGGYLGSYITELARDLGERLGHETLDALEREERLARFEQEAVSALRLGQEEALSAFLNALDRDRSLIECFAYMAKIHSDAKRWDVAFSYWQEVYDLYPPESVQHGRAYKEMQRCKRHINEGD